MMTAISRPLVCGPVKILEGSAPQTVWAVLAVYSEENTLELALTGKAPNLGQGCIREEQFDSELTQRCQLFTRNLYVRLST